MGLGVIRFQTQCFLAVFDRLFVLTCLDQSEGQVAVGVGIVGIQPQGLFKLFHRIVHSAFVGQYAAQVVADQPAIRIFYQRGLIQCLGVMVKSALPQCQKSQALPL